jgi:hypothetical protein
MTEQADTQTPKRGRGRPTKRSAEREYQRMPRGLDEDDVDSCKTELYTHHDPLHFPAEVLWAQEHEYGYIGGWFAYENAGQSVDNVTIRLRQGYQHAHRDSFQGLLKPYVAKRDGPITHRGLAYLVIPRDRYLKLRGLEGREAKAAP